MAILVAALLAAANVSPVGETRQQDEAAALAHHRRMDANHDGFVTYAEMREFALAAIFPKGQIPERLPNDRMARAEFDRADIDHDGRISIQEAIAGADRAFAEADTDHDGLLTEQERGAYGARALVNLQKEIATWKPLPCQPRAACATAR
ncbi:conserved hypothetical protein [Sphingomonas sp. EC-HK361]|uniref:EF-hand domain-containing protein n=1 Tax=Sphingomonas sp. EC-HK361 TaxID=2038397 RepID=UPI0012554169|nr:EF-hand domain-containing protein [Sphingomonas sp. EC-HK361]VVS96630.1 conserved hypothetical protein [Sphingomonas sp. EC-HK361]